MMVTAKTKNNFEICVFIYKSNKSFNTHIVSYIDAVVKRIKKAPTK